MVSSFRISRLEEEEEEGERHRKIRENKKRLSILRVSYESLTRELEELYKPRVVDLISRSHRRRLNSTENTVIMKRYHPVNVPVSNRVPPLPAIDVPVFALIVISWQQGNPFAARGRANRV